MHVSARGRAGTSADGPPACWRRTTPFAMFSGVIVCCRLRVLLHRFRTGHGSGVCCRVLAVYIAYFPPPRDGPFGCKSVFVPAYMHPHLSVSPLSTIRSVNRVITLGDSSRLLAVNFVALLSDFLWVLVKFRPIYFLQCVFEYSKLSACIQYVYIIFDYNVQKSSRFSCHQSYGLTINYFVT